MVLRTIIFILLMTKNFQTNASGFDAYSSCYRTSRKKQELPCDFGTQTWCTIPGNSYPWHAVRRFVHENQGLMRRMYGDERHISVLRAELESNNIEYFNTLSVKEEFRRRYSKDMDGTKDFVKILMSNDGRKLHSDQISEKIKKAEKIQKSIEEKSSNILNQNHIKKTKEEEFKSVSGNEVNKTIHKTTTIGPAITNASLTEPRPDNVTTSFPEPTVNQTTTEPTNPFPSFSTLATDTTVQTTVKMDNVQYNSTKLAPSQNETFDFDYGSETEETPTTTSLDALTTTETEYVEEESLKDKEEYEESVEEDIVEEAEAAEDSVSPQPSPIIRLKGINACPVKEEVVAPFWANNTRGEVLALLNLYPFEQYVHWEKCTFEHKQMFCREGCRCEQQYRLHRLLAYDPNNECRGIFSDWFRFPSCCVCKCYDLPMELRLTSRSPRFRTFDKYENLFGQKRNP